MGKKYKHGKQLPERHFTDLFLKPIDDVVLGTNLRNCLSTKLLMFVDNKSKSYRFLLMTFQAAAAIGIVKQVSEPAER